MPQNKHVRILPWQDDSLRSMTEMSGKAICLALGGSARLFETVLGQPTTFWGCAACESVANEEPVYRELSLRTDYGLGR